MAHARLLQQLKAKRSLLEHVIGFCENGPEALGRLLHDLIRIEQIEARIKK